ncbi:probable maleylacetoacetate isomerase 1 [Pectinophora gossypiella]|uniref:probable maleylacetoacetate isomerase 1 n=1 Tax=Pectinophora gossypiella TaxID=13191 RepID=UPI00214F4BD2|nr:probable maleylacetoacetate isomerase 1 [Pectinophora gossypiella]
MASSNVVLHAYYLSSCSWRVRAALHWKRIPFEERSVDIVRERNQLTDSYRAVNPAQKVPALVIDGETLVESMAILQYLEETRPEPTLEPDTPILRARMREICETIVSGIQPLQNVGLKSKFLNEEQFQEFAQQNTERGLQTLEALLVRTSRRFCVGDQITMADLCFVPQLYNCTTRLKLNIGKYPTVAKIYDNLIKESIFEKSHPKNHKPKK